MKDSDGKINEEKEGKNKIAKGPRKRRGRGGQVGACPGEVFEPNCLVSETLW